MRRRALRIRWRAGTSAYERAWLTLKVGLVAAPLAPFAAPLVGASLSPPNELLARAASVLAAGMAFVILVRGMTRATLQSQRTVGITLIAMAVSAALAAHLIAWRANSFFHPDLLYEIMATLFALSAFSAGLRSESQRPPETGHVEDGQPFFSPYRALSDGITRMAAWLTVSFWVLVAVGLRYIAAVILVLLAGAVSVTMLLRVAELVAPSFREARRK